MFPLPPTRVKTIRSSECFRNVISKYIILKSTRHFLKILKSRLQRFRSHKTVKMIPEHGGGRKLSERSLQKVHAEENICPWNIVLYL